MGEPILTAEQWYAYFMVAILGVFVILGVVTLFWRRRPKRIGVALRDSSGRVYRTAEPVTFEPGETSKTVRLEDGGEVTITRFEPHA